MVWVVSYALVRTVYIMHAAEIMGNAQGETTVLNSVLTPECYTSLRINSVLET